MPTVWFALRKSLSCSSEPQEVHDPKKVAEAKTYCNHQPQQNNNNNHHYHHPASIVTRKNCNLNSPRRSGCSRSIANLRDVIHSHSSRRFSTRGLGIHGHGHSSCSPRSIGSSDIFNPMMNHEVLLNMNIIGGSRCEFKISATRTAINGGLATPTKSLIARRLYENSDISFSDPPVPPPVVSNSSTPRFSSGSELENHQRTTICAKCGAQLSTNAAMEHHNLAKHAVTMLLEGDSSRNIVEIIFRTGWQEPENAYGKIDRILKVHNTQGTLEGFEEFRIMVKTKASKLQKKHPRCLADGNELLRFFGTTVMCSLGMNGSSNLCDLEGCNVCRIIRSGFSVKEVGYRGIYTTSTSGRALENIALHQQDDDFVLPVKKALLVCRVIAGRVHRPLDTFDDLVSGFDSVAGKANLFSTIEELFVLNPTALLPCFVIICR